MSQLLTLENLKELDTAPIFNDSIDRRISALINDSIDEFTTTGIDLITSNINSGKSRNEQKSSKVISSPQQLKMGFKEYFIQGMGEINTVDTLVKQKLAVVRTLQSMDYRIENPEQVIKDMKIAAESSIKLGLETPGLNLTLSLYEKMSDLGYDNNGTQALFKLFE